MERLHARYPFLDRSRHAVAAADVEIETVITTAESPILDRAVARVDGAVTDGRVPDPIPDVRVELLSYPVARILVSLVDDPVLTDRYALAEARRAFGHLEAELDETATFRSTDGERLTFEELLAEFDLADRVQKVDDGYEVEVAAFLSLSSELRGNVWQLVNRRLGDGSVPVDRGSLETLIREAIRLRVAEELPLDVPDPIATHLADDVAAIRGLIASVDVPDDVDVLVPEAFPPCIRSLYEDRHAVDSLTPDERFTLVTFLCCIGTSEEELLDLFEPSEAAGEQRLRYQFEHLHGETRSTAYPPPSFATLAEMGICEGSSVCQAHGHPIEAYAHRLERD